MRRSAMAGRRHISPRAPSPASRRRRCGRSRWCSTSSSRRSARTSSGAPVTSAGGCSGLSPPSLSLRAGYFRWRLFWPFAAVSIPLAFLGGAITLPGHAYKVLVGVVLIYAAWQLWHSARAGTEMREVRDPPLAWAMLVGAALGLLAGLTGVGGGIFLSPLLLLLGWAGTKQ